MSNHTKEPWMTYNADGGRTFKHWRIKNFKCKTIAKIEILESPETEYATARLIAAAPDLLKTLENIRGVARGKDDPEVMRRMIINMCKKAIYNATS